MEEPSVLDYVKAKIFFWRKNTLQFSMPDLDSNLEFSTNGDEVFSGPSREDGNQVIQGKSELEEDVSKTSTHRSYWPLTQIIIPIILAILAQRSLEPPGRSIVVGVILYLLAIVWLIWINFKGLWVISSPQKLLKENFPLNFKPVWIWICTIFSVSSFLLFGNNTFTRVNFLLWFLALFSYFFAFWQPDIHSSTIRSRVIKIWQRFSSQGIVISPWTLLVAGVFFLSAFYRLYLLNQVPAEMFSDHAEKLIDVKNVLDGQLNIFFPRNTGREAIQIYLTAAVSEIFNTGLSFISLKIGTALCGIITLPFVYLLGKEIANKRVGLYAMFFAGIAYWPNVISRVALRFTLYPTFTAPMLYFLLRGLQKKRRNDLILSGVFLGLGLHGYSPYRFVPIVLVLVILIYMVHQKSQQTRRRAFMGLGLIAGSSLIVFLPLLRYAVENPQNFSYRMLTRLGQAERDFPGSPLRIFFDNLWKSIIMPIWDNGQIWVHSIPNRPALGVVSASFLVLGIVLVLIRYLRERNWLDLTLIMSIPLFMMPSILSIAFPEENPSLNRSGGALIIIFIIVALAFDGFLNAIKALSTKSGVRWLAAGIGFFLIVGAAWQNYDLVFNQYANQFKTNAWNTSELGAVIRQFADTTGDDENAWVIPYPHWVDTRLVGVRAGFPERDFALWPTDISETGNDNQPKMFLIKPEDSDTIILLQKLYPFGVLNLFESQVEGRDFYMFSVPPSE